jgi:plastocyanin
MRFFGLAVASGALALAACGGDKGAANAAESAAADSAANATALATTGAGTEGALAMAPATGQVHEVKMLVDDAGNYKFDPANITVKQGDAVKWVMVSGGPHNVQFDEATVPAGAKAQLRANMPNMLTELGSPMMMNNGETYQISFASIPAGKYPYVCQPHIAMNMTGVVTVQ